MNRFLWMSIVIVSLLAGMPARAQPPATADAADEDTPVGDDADPDSTGSGTPGPGNAGPGTPGSGTPGSGTPGSGNAGPGNPGWGRGISLAPPGSGATTPAPSLPWVAGVPLAQRQEANRIFQEGNVLIRQGLFSLAAARYREALALWDHPGFRYNLAITQINLDQPIAAYESFLHATRYGARPLGDDTYAQAQSFLTLLRNQLAHVEVVCDEPGATVTLDGKPLFVGPGQRTLMALPGGHVLMASKEGRLPDSEQIVLAPGQRTRFALAPAYPDRVITVRRWPAWRPWVVLGAGAVVVAGGGYLDWRAERGFDRFDRALADACTGTRGCEASAVAASVYEQRDRARALQWSARATYIAGGTVLAGSAVLLYMNRERQVKRPGADEVGDVSLVPVLGPQFAGVSAHREF